MTTYITILRGINVSGHRMIKMNALKELLQELGFQKIQTYIQSGNIVFQTRESDPQKLEKKIANAILEKFGFDVPVLVKEREALRQIISQNPFLSDPGKDVNHLHVTFLSGEPDPEYFNKISDLRFEPDEFQIGNQVIYLYCPVSYGNSKLSNTFFEKALKVTATTRNWKTTNELQNIAEEIANS